MEKIDWKLYFRSHPQQLKNVRVRISEDKGFIRFAGPLVHQGRPADSQKQIWAGIEWDDASRGKHNGTVRGHRYFTTKQNLNSGTIVKFQKLQFGQTFFMAFLLKYFRKNQLDNAYNFYLNKHQSEQTTLSDVHEEKRPPLIQFDQQAYFQTNRNAKRMVQFVGFDKIWEKIHDLKKLKEISLAHLKIMHIGRQGQLKNIFPNLQVLSLQNNLLFSWHQVFLIGHELSHLRQLSLKQNCLQHVQQPISLQTLIVQQPYGKSIPYSPYSIFKNLKVLILMKMRLTWKCLANVLPAFPCIQQLALCNNYMTDYQHLQSPVFEQGLKNLKNLNLDHMGIANFQYLCPLGKLQNLSKISMNNNQVKSLGKLQGFKNIRVFQIDYNRIEDPIVLSEIAQFRAVQNLSVKHNPVNDKLGSSYVRQRAIAEMPRLIYINSSDLGKYERKDCEIFYMKRSFEEYFTQKRVKSYDYDVRDFQVYKNKLHPNLDRLIQKYGNPYPCESKEIVKLIQAEEKLLTVAKPMTGMAEVQVQFRGLNSIVKMPISWKFSSVRNYFSKNFKVNSKCLKLQVQATQQQNYEVPEDHKQMSFYGIRSGSKIRVTIQS